MLDGSVFWGLFVKKMMGMFIFVLWKHGWSSVGTGTHVFPKDLGEEDILKAWQAHLHLLFFVHLS